MDHARGAAGNAGGALRLDVEIRYDMVVDVDAIGYARHFSSLPPQIRPPERLSPSTWPRPGSLAGT